MSPDGGILRLGVVRVGETLAQVGVLKRRHAGPRVLLRIESAGGEHTASLRMGAVDVGKVVALLQAAADKLDDSDDDGGGGHDGAGP